MPRSATCFARARSQTPTSAIPTVIFLTHNAAMHEVNLGWHPRAEELLWRPDLQEAKVSQTGGHNVRYRRSVKAGYVRAFTGLVRERLPPCEIRYAF